MEDYRIKDVIFGLRAEYLEIEKLLKQLELQITVKGDDELGYSIIKEGNNTDLKINLLKRQSVILQLIQKFGKNVADTYEYRLPLHKLFNGGEHGLIISDSRYIKLPEEGANEFYATAHGIINRPIVQTSPHYIRIEDKDDNFVHSKRIDISPLGVNVDVWEKHLNQQKVPSEFVSYVMDSDSINYSAYRDLALRTDLADLLDAPINADELNKVEKDIIKKSNVLNKKVTIFDYTVLDENQSFNIEDTHDEIILSKK